MKKNTPNSKKILAWLVFAIAIIFHLIGFNRIGRTWDEQFKLDLGLIGWQNIFHGRLDKEYWLEGIEHPMIAKYMYGAFYPLGLIDTTAPFTPSPAIIKNIERGMWLPTQLYDRIYLATYDFTAPRLVSAFFNSVTVTLTYFLAIELVGPALALIAPAALLFSPRFLVMGQLVTYESLSAMLLVLLLFSLRKHRIYLASLIAALGFWTRYTNAYFFVFIALYLLFNRPSRQQLVRWLTLPLIVFAVGMLSWPLLWHNFPTFLIRTFTEHQSRGIGPSLYFINQLLFTTPVPILVLTVLGFFRAGKFVNLWFLSTLVFFSLLSVPGGGTRYLFVIYPSMALLAAMGAKLLTERLPRALSLSLASLFLVWLIVSQITHYPYYLDYYNELVGGPTGAVKKGYAISWWGEGQRDAALWLREHAEPGSKVALYVTPRYVFPALFFPRMELMPYETGVGEAEYMVVSRANLSELAAEQLTDYHSAYEVTVPGGASLVTVFEKIK